MDIIMENKKESGTSSQSLFGSTNMFKSFLSLVSYHLVKYDVLFQKSFGVTRFFL